MQSTTMEVDKYDFGYLSLSSGAVFQGSMTGDSYVVLRRNVGSGARGTRLNYHNLCHPSPP